ncbi:MAG: hypothetical protein NVSMB25_24090 [Thermoleophilaceae bacterium]
MQGEVVVLGVDLARSGDEVSTLAGLLGGDELRRAANMRVEAGRRRFIVTRASLRLILGERLSSDPAELEFVRGANGKPALSPGAGLGFNVAHSGELALVALAAGGEVGIDIERIQPRRDPMRVARRYFSPAECAAIEAVDGADRLDAFYRHWVAKEAYVKATGEGIAATLSAFTVELGPSASIRGAEERWALTALDVGTGYAAALVCEQPLLPVAAIRAFDPLAP